MAISAVITDPSGVASASLHFKAAGGAWAWIEASQKPAEPIELLMPDAASGVERRERA